MLMKAECVTCILNQVIRITDHLGVGEVEKDTIFKLALDLSSKLDYTSYLPPLYSEKLYDSVSDYTGVRDPYKQIRREQNDLIIKNRSFFMKKIVDSSDPIFMSLYYSLLGNIIDYGGVELFSVDNLFETNDPEMITINDYKQLYENLKLADSLLVIADNAGEAVFDMMFLEQVKKIKPEMELFYGVKSGPAINDVLKDDALYIGINKYAKIIETGATYAGTVVTESQSKFKKIFLNSDIVISKGQGNFETLESERSRDIFFVFKVKCKVVSKFSGLGQGALVMGYRNTFPEKE